MIKIISLTVILILIVNSSSGCSDNCYECDLSTSSCIACSDPYQRTVEGKCIKPQTENCILANANGLCYKCKPTFKLINAACIKQFSGCVKYGTSGKCVECAFGTILSNDMCMGVLNCIKPADGYKCDACADGFKLQNGQCKSQLVNCTQTDFVSGACKKCSQGNTLFGYRCVSDYIEPEFCYVYDETGQCSYCKEGFTNLEGTCYTSGQIQKIYAGQKVKSRRILKGSQGASQQQQQSSTQKNSTIISNSSSSSSTNSSTQQKKPANPIDRCSRYDQSLTKCLTCENGYALVNQTCFYAIEGCNSYQTVGKTVVCKQCDSNYELQPKTSVCLKKAEEKVKNCLIPNLDQSKCIVCNSGFTLSNGQCVTETVTDKNLAQRQNCDVFDETAKKCKTCLNNFTLKNGFCLDNNCARFNAQVPNQCQTCKNNFKLSSSSNYTCQFNDVNCEQVVSQKCAKCVKTHFVNNEGSCTAVPYGCQIPNAQTLLCSICLKDFTLLSNGTCRLNAKIQNCVLLQTNQNAINKCASCIDGYYPSFDQCKKVSARCNGYDKDTGSCIACKDNFVLSKGKCTDVNCVKQSKNLDQCDQCKDGFKFKNGACRFDDVNCQVVMNQTCQQCFEEYTFDKTKGKCVLTSEINKVNQTQTNNNTTQNNQSSIAQNQSSTSNSLTNSSSFTVTPKPATNNQTSTVSNSTQQVSPQQNTTNSTPETQSQNQSSPSTPSPTQPIKIPNCVYQSPINPKYCLQCQPQFTLSSDSTQCISTPSTPQIAIQKDPNCQIIDPNNLSKCLKCNDRFYINSTLSKCTEVNQLCQDYDFYNGACLSCFEGFYLENGRCFLKVQIDPYCVQRAVEGCVKCVDGYFVDQNKAWTCQKVSQFCDTYNLQSGNCLTCKNGYTFVSGQCINLADDPNCIQFSSDKRFCQKCSQFYFVNTMTQKCQKINQNCKTYNQATGQCYTCKQNYKLTKGMCQKAILIQQYVKDYYCKTLTKNVCTQCYNGYYLNLENVCKQKNPICKEISRQNGDCTSCYQGYYLVGGACIVPNNLHVTTLTMNKNCKVFLSAEVDSCTECYKGYRLAQGVCLEINQLCKDIDQKTGLCLSCYEGYYLEGGNCLIDMSYNPNELDPYCTQLSPDFSNCVQCASGYFVNDDGYCQPYNTSNQCETFNPQTGFCLTCPYGYILTKSKICIQEVRFCSQYDQSITLCVQCATGYYVKGGQCYPRDIKCEIYDAKTGNCNKCIAGHILFDNQCIFPTFGADRYCAKYVNSYCTKCVQGSYLFNYRCREIDVNCQKFDYTLKRCLECKNGLKARGIACVSEN